MKKTIKTSLTLIALITTLISCNENEGDLQKKKKVTFSFQTKQVGQPGTRLSEADISKIIVTIKDLNDNIVKDRVKISLIKTASGKYISKEIELEAGNYKITEFIVANEANQAIYATPVTGSALANLVANPLPILFSTIKDDKVNTQLEVVPIEGTDLSDFGLNTFSFLLTSVLNIQVTSIVTDVTSESGLSFTESSIVISGSSDEIYSGALSSKFNKISIKTKNSAGVVYESFTIEVRKPNFLTYFKTFTLDELKALNETPLTVNLQPDLTSGLQAYYPFNGNSNDESGNGLHATRENVTLTTDRKGNANKAYSFNGISSGITGSASNMGITNTFSASFWTKPKSASHGQFYITDYDYLNGFYVSSSSPLGLVFDSRDGSGINNRTNNSDFIIEDETWYNIVIVGKRNIRKLYVNGILLKTIDTGRTGNSENFANPTKPFTMGYLNSDDLTNRLDGVLDDVRIYNRVLSQTAVTALFNE